MESSLEIRKLYLQVILKIKCNGPLYDLLYSLLEKLEPSIRSITEVGCGPNAPSSRFLNHFSKHPISYTFLDN